MVTDYKCWKANKRQAVALLRKKALRSGKQAAQRAVKADKCESKINLSERKKITFRI